MKLVLVIISILILGCKSISDRNTPPSISDYPILKECDSIGQVAQRDYHNGIKIYDILGEHEVNEFELFWIKYMKENYNILIKASSQASFEEECYAEAMVNQIEEEYGKEFMEKTYKDAKIKFENRK